MIPKIKHDKRRQQKGYLSNYLVTASLAAALVLPAGLANAADAARSENMERQPIQTAGEVNQENMERTGQSSQAQEQPIRRGNRALVDREIRSQNGDTIGEIENVVVDANGQVQYIIASIDGFWGVGSEEAMVPIDKLSLTKHRRYVYFKGTEEEMEMYPNYSDYGWAGRRYGSPPNAWFNTEQQLYEDSDPTVTGWTQRRATTRGQDSYTTTNYGGTDINRSLPASSMEMQQDRQHHMSRQDQQQRHHTGSSNRDVQAYTPENRQNREMRSANTPLANINLRGFGDNTIQASRLMDKEVRNQNDEKLGSVDDVLITSNGDMRLILAVGKALNLENKRVLADLADIRKAEDGDYLVYDVSKKELKNDPHYRPERTASLQGEAQQGKKMGKSQARDRKENMEKQTQ